MHPRLSVHTVGFGDCALAELAGPLTAAGVDHAAGHPVRLAVAGLTGPVEPELADPRITAERPPAAAARAVTTVTALL